MIDASIVSLLGQIPLVGIFVGFTLHRDKLAAAERRELVESWQLLLRRSEDSQSKLAEGQVDALREIAQEHREAQDAMAQRQQDSTQQILEGQAIIRRSTAKIIALLVARMISTGTLMAEAKELVRELLQE